MSSAPRPFFDRLRAFEEVLDAVSTRFDRRYRFTPVFDVNPKRVVSVAVERVDVSSRPKVFVPASDRDIAASSQARAEFERQLGDAVGTLRRRGRA